MLDVDVLIVGGGLVGSSLATALASHPLAKGLSVMVVDPYPPAAGKWPALSLRTSTITPSSRKFLDDIGVWSCIPSTRIAPFDKMFVWDHPSPLPRAAPGSDLGKVPPGTLTFSAADVGEEVLGYVVDNDTLRTAMYRAMEELSAESETSLRIAEGMVYAIDYGNQDQVAGGTHSAYGSSEENSTLTGGEDWAPFPIIELDNGEKIRCRLLAACDGSRSRIRPLAQADWFSRGYGQSAVVANVSLRAPIDTAYQRFVSTGPVAVLPVARGDMEAPVGNVIWTTTKMEAEALAAADDTVFLNELNIVLSAHEENNVCETQNEDDDVYEVNGKKTEGDLMLWNLVAKGLQVALPKLGIDGDRVANTEAFEPPECTGVIGRRGTFPLVLGHTPRYVIEEKRTVFVGDAAHSVHPLAGQGVNLGFADVRSLADCLASAAATGRDVGGERGAPLMRFQRDRLIGNVGMMGVLHSLQQVFDRDSPAGFRELRRVGMSTLNAVGPVKRFILRAMR